MTGQQVCIPDSNSAKALSDSRCAGDALKYLATLEYNGPFPWSMSLEIQRSHMNKAPIAEKTIRSLELNSPGSSSDEHAWCDTIEEEQPTPGWTAP